MKVITSLFALAAMSTFSFAAEPAAAGADKPKRDPEAAFKKMDANADNSLTLEEFTANKKDAAKAEAAFGKRDKDGDGKLTLEEFKGGQKKQQQ